MLYYIRALKILQIAFLFTVLSACRPDKAKIEYVHDWPCYQHDNRSSGVTDEQLEFPLFNSWQYIPQHAPKPAWPEPAKADFYHEVPKLAPLVTYDRAFHVTVMNNLLYFVSSADNKVYCLDAETGKERWTFFTNAPNRTVPALYKAKVYFGSDDGFLYCLNAKDGKIVWKYKATQQNRKIIGNGSMVSVCPVRTGTVVQNDTVFYAAGLFPKEEVYVIALNADNGTEIWKKKQNEIAPQGYPVASNLNIYIPNSRSRPFVFNLKTGEQTNKYTIGPGGDYIALTENELFYGINNSGEITADDFLTAAFSGHRLIIKDNVYFIASDYQLTAINKINYDNIINQRMNLKKNTEEITAQLKKLQEKRKNLFGQKRLLLSDQIDKKIDELSGLGQKLKELEGQEIIWEQSIVRAYSMILTKDALIVGENDKVSAYSISNGQQIWSSSVKGKVYGLAVSNAKLFISTDKGNIYCFSSNEQKEPAVIEADKKSEPFKKNKFYSEVAEYILQESNIKKGFCLVLGCSNGFLAYELAKQSDLNIICVEKDPEKVKKMRRKFDRAGLYGNRVTIYEGTLKEIAFTDYFANLIVTDKLFGLKRTDEPVEEILRVLCPGGGIAYFGEDDTSESLKKSKSASWFTASNFSKKEINTKYGKWMKIVRGKLPKSGEWTHLYANVENTASSGDQLVNDSITTQWFGEPGPREMADRHHRAVSPLFKNGIVYIPGYCRIFAADAYNGTLLWNEVLSDFNRLGIFRDAGNMALTDDHLYVALKSLCIGLNPKTGKQSLSLTLPQLVKGETRFWGYLAIKDSQMFGSGRKPEAAFNSMSKQDDDELWGDYQRSVTSDYVFSLDRFTGKMLWSYKSGVILNPSITIGNNRMYFLESQNPEALEDKDGLMKPEKLLGDKACLIALDISSGKVVWEKKFNIDIYKHSIFLSYAKEMLIAVTSKNKNNTVWYDVYAYDATNGEKIWHREQDNEKRIRGDHGEQHLHPAIVGDRVYAEPYAYDLQTGKPIADWKLVRNGHGCGTISASANNLFYRADNPALCNLYSDETTRRINSVTRPGCWINIIPAGGLVIIPEASSGCTCDFPLQMSIAYLPKRY